MAARSLRSWRTKARLQRLLSAVPAGERVNWLLQRHVTHSYPASSAKVLADADLARRHLAALDAHGSTARGASRLYEFGAGWDLAMPLLFHGLGVEHQVLVDIRPLARPELVFDLARRLDPEVFGLQRALPAPAGSLSGYLERLGIDYRAPADARATGLPDGSFDCITSSNTLEHIPARDLLPILTECRRLLAPGGVCSFHVDYTDHYSHFDDSISPFNFLQFDDAAWRRFNPDLHHQNRLRHPDYLSLYEEASFVRVQEERIETTSDRTVVEALPLARAFRSVPVADLAVRGAHVVLTRGKPSGSRLASPRA